MIIPTLVALIALAQGSTDTKAKAVAEVLSGRRFMKPAPLGIRASKESARMNSQGKQQFSKEN